MIDKRSGQSAQKTKNHRACATVVSREARRLFGEIVRHGNGNLVEQNVVAAKIAFLVPPWVGQRPDCFTRGDIQ
jgi:hypothetical protein